MLARAHWGSRGLGCARTSCIGVAIAVFWSCCGPLCVGGQTPAPDGFNPGADNTVFGIAVTRDRQVLVGGSFGTLGGVPRLRIGRLNDDGTADPWFDPGASGSVAALAPRPDGTVLVGGSFGAIGGRACANLGRLGASGVVDVDYNARVGDPLVAVVPLPNGGTMVGGWFVTVGTQACVRVARLHADGSLDKSFADPKVGHTVTAMAVQPDGKVVVGGTFTSMCGQPRSGIGRLNPDGTLDTGFDPGCSGTVYSLAVEADGGILVGGAFLTLAGQTRHRIARLHPDGSLDEGFAPDINGTVSTLALQADGMIVLGGAFTSACGLPRNRIARVHHDGAVDMAFDPNADGEVYALALQADGALLVGGAFTSIGGQARSRIARLHGLEVATDELTFANDQATWLRGGTAPEVWRTTFEHSPDGTTWVSLGEGTRIQGGWATSAVGITGGTFRARGYAASGYANGSVGEVEVSIGAPAFIIQPSEATNAASSTVTFRALAIGDEPIGYRWSKDGVELVSTGSVSGASAPVLEIRSLLGADDGAYTVVASNALGSVTSTVARLTVKDPAIRTSPVGQIVEVATNVLFSIDVAGTGPLGFQWNKDGVPLAGATSGQLVLSNVQSEAAGIYSVTVLGANGSVTSAGAELIVHPAGLAPGANGSIRAVAVEPSGSLLVGGDFTMLGGLPRNRIGRVLPNGIVDVNFDPNAAGSIHALAVQPDGKILVGGQFLTICGDSCANLARLHPDGTRDTGFAPSPDGAVLSLTVQDTGRIVASGGFSYIGGMMRRAIARLNANGTVDSSFYASAAPFGVYTVAVQPDGKVLVGGSFTRFGAQTRSRIARLSATGALDLSFAPAASLTVQALALQPDGKILVGGEFSMLNGQTRNRIARLLPDGTLDVGFNPDADGTVRSLAVQADGRVVFCGDFTRVRGQPRDRIAAVSAAGTLDSACAPGADATVRGIALQADGNVILAGDFSAVAGQPRGCLARWVNDVPPTEALAYDGTAVTWMRGGSAPEVVRTSLEFSGNGTEWVFLGAGVRTTGGWTVQGVTIGTGSVRARGYTTCGQSNGSGGIVQSGLGAPGISEEPADCARDAGRDAFFRVAANGAPPFSYRWRKGGGELQDGGDTAGAGTATLTIANVLAADAGAYDVVVGNAMGNATSRVALLTVVDPAIRMHPAGQNAVPGANVELRVEAVGTAPLTYQWRKDGQELAGATDAVLELAAASTGTEGDYDVVVGGPSGCTTSAVARVRLRPVVDAHFDPSPGYGVLALAVQPDRGILVGGSFPSIGGQPIANMARVHPDGTLDTDFSPAPDGSVEAIAVQADGRVIVGGQFEALGGQPHNHIARLEADGTVDTGFNASANGRVCALAIQPDGAVLLGGWFTSVNGQPRGYVGRLHPDGTLDEGFAPAVDDVVSCVALQRDGRVLLGGWFRSIDAEGRPGFARLRSDGALDATFLPAVGGVIYSLALGPDGKIVVGANFIARVEANGALDAGFSSQVGNLVETLALQADGRIVVGGNFRTLGGVPCSGIGRLNADGSPDLGFVADANGFVYCVAIQSNGAIILGGNFTEVGGVPRAYLARLHNTAPPSSSLATSGTMITWLRAGTAPEVSSTTFEHSTDGTDWTLLGEGQRRADGWQLDTATGLSGAIRARGVVSGGDHGASTGIVEESTDTDGDGIPDGWTLRHFGHTTGQEEDLSRAGDDASGTGQSNRFKYVAGLDPRDPDAVFRLNLGLDPGPPARPKLVFGPRWPTRSYTPLYRSSLTGDELWQVLSETEINDAGTQRTLFDLDPGGTSRFYRLRISYP